MPSQGALGRAWVESASDATHAGGHLRLLRNSSQNLTGLQPHYQSGWGDSPQPPSVLCAPPRLLGCEVPRSLSLALNTAHNLLDMKLRRLNVCLE